MPSKKPAPKKASTRRPIEDRPKLAAAVFARMALGSSLRAACEAEGLKVPTVMLWVDEDPTLAEQYTRAMLARADAKFEELDDVSEQATKAESAVEVQGLRLKADNIKWQLARMNARKYGEKLAIGGAEDLGPIKTMPDEALDAKLQELMDKARADQG